MNIQWVHIYKPRNIFLLFSLDDHNDFAGHFSTFEEYSFKNSVVIGMDDKLWNGSEEDADVRSECGEDEGTDCEDVDSDTGCDVVCIKCMKLIVKYFFLAEVLFWGVALDLDQHVFLWQLCFWGVRLELPGIWVNTVTTRCPVRGIEKFTFRMEDDAIMKVSNSPHSVTFCDLFCTVTV
jgi:hypothetical protein